MHASLVAGCWQSHPDNAHCGLRRSYSYANGDFQVSSNCNPHGHPYADGSTYPNGNPHADGNADGNPYPNGNPHA